MAHQVVLVMQCLILCLIIAAKALCSPAWLRLQLISKWKPYREYLCESNIAHVPV